MAIYSPYFDRAESKSLTCMKRNITEFTSAYDIELIMKTIEFGSPEGESIRFQIDSSYNNIFHFFDWKFRSIWAWQTDKYEEAYSEASGIMTP